MIVRIDIRRDEAEGFSYDVSAEHEALDQGAGFSSIVNALASAVEGLGPDARAAEIALQGVVSGTYPLATIATRPHDVVQHALNTLQAIVEAERG